VALLSGEVAGNIDPDNRETINVAWLAKGNPVFELAEEFERNGHYVSARKTYLRAFNYLRSAEFFMKLGDDRKLATYNHAIVAFNRALKYFDQPVKRVEIPFEGSFLPGDDYVRRVGQPRRGALLRCWNRA